MVSIIVPVYNEERALTGNSPHLQILSEDAEIIFTDGGSIDRSVAIAGHYGRVVCGKKGRALQMNYGARLAGNDILLFMHADTSIAPGTLSSIGQTIADGYIGGCLSQRIGNNALVYRLIEWQGNMRAALTHEFFGDQGIFVRKDIFLKIGGFPEVPIMEDVLFTRKLRKAGKTLVLPDKIMVSARRWEKRGVARTLVLYNLITMLFCLRVPLDKIKSLYEDLR